MQTAMSLAGIDLGEYMASLKMTFAANLRRILREKDLKSKDLAERIGVSPSNVTHWRNADKFPSPENIEAICRELGIQYFELFRSDVDPLPSKRSDLEKAFYALAEVLRFDIKKRTDG